MQIRLAWTVYGPGTQSGLLGLSSLLSAAGATVTGAPQVATAPAQVLEVRRESFEGVADYGLTALVRSTLAPRGSADVNFPAEVPDVAAFDDPRQIAAATAAVEALRPRIARITTATRINVLLSFRAPLSDAQRRNFSQQVNAALVTYLERNGGFLLASPGARSSSVAERSGGGVVFMLLLLGGAAWAMSRASRA